MFTDTGPVRSVSRACACLREGVALTLPMSISAAVAGAERGLKHDDERHEIR